MASSNAKRTLTALEKVDLALRGPLVFFPSVIFNCVRCASLAWQRGLPVKPYLATGLLRTILGTLSPRQIQYLSLTVVETYENWMAKRTREATKNDDTLALSRLNTHIEHLSDGRSSLLWIGNREEASRYILFVPGGGFIAPLTSGHLEWCWQAYVKGTGREEVAVAVLQYTLCPEARHPIQLQQATAALRHLLDSGIPPSCMVVGGDSAGGNLVAQLLGHLAEPGDASTSLTEPLAGVFLVSPWLSGMTNTYSFYDNGWIDMLSPGHTDHSLREFANFTKAKAPDGPDVVTRCGLPLDDDDDGEWMVGWEKVTKALYVTVGANEVLRDQGVLFAEAVRRRNRDVRVRLDILETDAHDFILLNGMELINTDGSMSESLPPRLASHQAEILLYFEDEG
ncbi:Alpha/Beta hydrolase protein [Xylaria arbuscula]|nr:Alpha/Beta hydrolase protein [Xylaria arbuscula]